MTGAFDAATAVELVGVADGVHRYRAEVHDGWDIGGNANGGYVLAIAGRAMADAVGRPPLTRHGPLPRAGAARARAR